MKVSKVDHAKSAVKIVASRDGQEGVIYVDPAEKGRAVRNTAKRIEKRSNQAKRLYNIFNAYTKNKNEDPRVKEIHDAVNKRGLGKALREECGYDVKKVKDYLKKKAIHGEYDPHVVDCSISRFLRRALSHDKSREGFRNILLVYTGCSEWNDCMSDSIMCFLEKYHADYDKSYRPKGIDGKEKKAKNELMQKSVKNQNLVIQPSLSETGILMLSGTHKSNRIKKSEKEAFSSFLSDYANLDENYRKDMRLRLRRLLVLYFYGGEEAKSVENEWLDYDKRKAEGTMFSKIETKEYKGKDGKQRKKTIIDTDDIRKQNIAKYRSAIEVSGSDDGKLFFSDQDINRFWIHHFENAVERITDRVKEDTFFKLKNGYLSEKVWKDALNLMSIKYIAIGKAIYNFALKDISDMKKDRTLGKLDPKYKDGFSSFDYEQIKAGETLQRELSVYIAFAANNLARATVDMEKAESGSEDFMLYKKEDLRDVAKQGLRRKILQFFGGASTWVDYDFDRYYKDDDIEFLKDIQQAVYSLRNESFHFDSLNKDKVEWNTEAVSSMFAHEVDKCAGVPKDKFFSNNLNLFYKEQDLRSVLDTLYSKYSQRASQVPAFNTVFVRKNFPLYLRDELHINPSFGQDYTSKLQSALYYLFKEVYYNRFLQDENVRELFFAACKKLTPKPGDEEKSQKAIEDFRIRCEELKSAKYPLAQICQIIMTEQNQQNNKRKVQSTKSSDKSPRIFQHYKMLLFKCLMDAFTEYIKRNEYSFIYSPALPSENNADKTAEDFMPDWKAGMYKELTEKVKGDTNLQKWYICGRLINGRQLNLMAGSMRSYIQYAEDIKRRAEETECPLKLFDNSTIEKCNRNLEVLDMCRQLSGCYTHEFTDYFDDEDEYAAYLKNYLAYDRAGYDELSSDVAKLRAFCDEEIIEGQKIGIYHDATNPILNKNILQAKLFGPDVLLKKTVRKVDREDLEKYYGNRERLEEYRVKGVCDTRDEQRELNGFMELKNRIEFRNVADYGEIVNELLGQLITWSYLRERDLLYYQLGFHYSCLHNNSEKPEGYDILVDKDGHKTEGVILHQITALYINGLPVYMKDKDKIKAGGANASAGSKISLFSKYEEEVLGVNKYRVYEAGLELFENLNEHENIIHLRNYIDHFKYYVGADRSLMDLYGEIHDRFFTYDMKYQKNVTNMLKNILLKHFVSIDIGYSTGKKMAGKEEKTAAKFVIKDAGITSDEFTYKTKEGKQYTLQARSDRYLEDIAAILVYPSKEYTISSLIGETRLKDESDKPSGTSNRSRGGKGRDKQGDENRNEYEKRAKDTRDVNVGAGLMAEAFKNIKL